MNFFQNCRTVEEIKTEYRKLARQHHPDLGGDTATMQAVNAAYHEALARCNGQTTTDNQGNPHRYTYNHDTEQAIMDKISALLKVLPAYCEVLLIGSWVWILGTRKEDTEARAALKAEKAMWHSKRLCWYWRAFESKHYGRQSRHDLSGLAARYGCRNFAGTMRDEQNAVATA